MSKQFETFSSVDSGFIEVSSSSSSLKMNIGEAVKVCLLEAQKENRLICGLDNVSIFLKEVDQPENSLFFFITPSTKIDSMTHIQEVILQSFCFENDIYIVKLDSSEKLSKILNLEQHVTCALIQKKSANASFKDNISNVEKLLIDNCEDFWDEPIQPIIKLPEH
jgi:growth arrest and DNA-damage-inducible protein